jgi:hypothetical protein
MDKISDAAIIVQKYADEADKFRKSVTSMDKQASRIITIIETFLKEKKRIIYGGAAINALLPNSLKFYDPVYDLPDYDFLTPDALTDCALLMEKYKIAGYIDVETRLGIHEGTYKIFVNYRAAADITEIPKDIYERIHKKSRKRDGLFCAPPDWLRMAAYLELSRPLGDVTQRWKKVFTRLQILNKVYPLKVANCKDPDEKTRFPPKKRKQLHAIILKTLTDTRSLFAGAMLEGIYKALQEQSATTEKILGTSLIKYDPRYVIITETLDETTNYLAAETKAQFPANEVKILTFKELGELLPERREVMFAGRRIATIFPTVACHAFYTMSISLPDNKKKQSSEEEKKSEEEKTESYLVRVASMDTSITLLYAMWFGKLQKTVGLRILCVLQSLIEVEAHMRLDNPKESKITLFPYTCLGHQPSLPELKKAHRERVLEKKESVKKYLESILHKMEDTVV